MPCFTHASVAHKRGGSGAQYTLLCQLMLWYCEVGRLIWYVRNLEWGILVRRTFGTNSQMPLKPFGTKFPDCGTTSSDLPCKQDVAPKPPTDICRPPQGPLYSKQRRHNGNVHAILDAPPGRWMPAAVQMPTAVRMPACHSRRFKGQRPIGATTG